MSIIYDDISGARQTSVFGCPMKNITVQMGFNSQPIVFTVTVVEETVGTFTLGQTDVKSVQEVDFGSLDLLGIVQSWEKTTIDQQGTGIYVVRLTDCRTVLDTAQLLNVYTPDPNLMASLGGSNTISTITVDDGGPDPTASINMNVGGGLTFATIINRLEEATLSYGNDTFEVDLSELEELTTTAGDTASDYAIQGEVRSVTSAITEFCNAIGAEWWVESHRKSDTDDTVVIVVKAIRRVDGIENPNRLEMDELAALHGDRVIMRKDGYENNDVVTNKILWGGIRQKLMPIIESSISPFWGFDTSGVPLSSPAYQMPDDPPGVRMPVSLAYMQDVRNGVHDGKLPRDQLLVLEAYIDEYWGRKFYCTVSTSTLSASGNSAHYPEVVDGGWWEGINYPQGSTQFPPETLLKMTSPDGRWGPFVRLPNLFTVGDPPESVNNIVWDDRVKSTSNFIQLDDDAYMQCTLEQHDQYVVITMPTPLIRYELIEGAVNISGTIPHEKIDRAWIPLMDKLNNYGPWTNSDLHPSVTPLPGRCEVNVDSTLVPWMFGTRDMSHAEAMTALEEAANKRIDVLPSISIINTGQLEVADIPRVNIGQAIGTGGSVTEVFVRYGPNGITTRYVMNLYTKELGLFRRQNQRIREEQEIEDARELEHPQYVPPDPYPIPEREIIEEDVRDALEEIIDEALTDIEDRPPDEPHSIMDPFMRWSLETPTGGMGIIVSRDGGPFYTVRRLSHVDIDPHTFAAHPVFGVPEWPRIRNLAEPLNSPGLLQVDTKVTVKIFSESEHGPFTAYIEQTPQTFSPPPIET